MGVINNILGIFRNIKIFSSVWRIFFGAFLLAGFGGILNAAQSDSATHSTTNSTKPQTPPPSQHSIPKKAEPDPSKILECNVIFEARKGEIQSKLQSINEKMQNLEVFRNATQNLLQERENAIKERENALQNKIKEFENTKQQANNELEQEKQAIKDLIAKNEEILNNIKTASNDKVAKTFAGMKDSKAAPIIAELDDAQAANILSSLSSVEMAKILAKMDSKRAAQLTDIISKGPPYEKPAAPEVPGQANEINQDELDSMQYKFQQDGGI